MLEREPVPDQLGKGRHLTGKPTLHPIILAETSACWSNSYISRNMVSSSWAHARMRASARPNQLGKGKHFTDKPTLPPTILAEHFAFWSSSYIYRSMVSSSRAQTQTRASARPDQVGKGRHLIGKPIQHPIILAESFTFWNSSFISRSLEA